MNDGFILLHRKIIEEWEWYNNVNDRLVFIHCLLKAYWKDKWYDEIKIPRGSFPTSYKKLAKEIGISIQQLRTSLEHLKSTRNITQQTTQVENQRFSIITIENYDKYQSKQHEEQHTSNTNRNKEIILSMYVSNNNTHTCARTREKIFNQVEMDMLDIWLEEFDFELVKEAVKISLLKHKEDFRYTNGILYNWKEKGYKTLEDVRREERPVEKEEPIKAIDIPDIDWVNMSEEEFYGNVNQ